MSEDGQVKPDGTVITMHEALEKWRQPALDIKGDNLNNPSGHDVELSAQGGLALSKQAKEDRELLRKNLPEFFRDEHIEELEGLSLAVRAAEIEVQQARVVPKNKATEEVVSRSRKVRDVLLKYTDELWPDHEEVAREVKRIREGRGHLDLSQDCLALVNLYNKYQQDMDPDTQNDFNYARYVGEAEKLGNELFHLLVINNPMLERVRNGVWTLFKARYDRLQDQGSFVARQLKLSDPGYDDRYPPLGRVSRSAPRSSAPTQGNPPDDSDKKLPWEK